MERMEQGQPPAPSSLPTRWFISPPPTGPRLALFARSIGLLSTALCIWWIQTCNGGVGWAPKPLPAGGNDTAPVFCWHPILVMIGFTIFMSEAVLTYQSPLIPGISRINRKRVHYTCHSLAVLVIILGLIAAFQSHNLKLPSPIPNLYSSHSFLGMVTVVLLALQYVVGFASYLFPTTPLSYRVTLGPIHRFFGMSTWVVGLATCAVGFMERSSILQFTKANIYGMPLTMDQLRSPTLAIPATIEVLLVVLAMAVLYYHMPATGGPLTSDARGALTQPATEAERTALKSGPSKPAAGSGEGQRSRQD